MTLWKAISIFSRCGTSTIDACPGTKRSPGPSCSASPRPGCSLTIFFQRRAVESLVVDTEQMEGYVVRLADGFPFDAFARSVAKWVRPGHVQTDQHWMHAQVVPNGLRDRETDP